MRRHRLTTLILWLLVFSPGVFMTWYVAEHAVDVPCMDDWENAPLLKKWHDGTLGVSDLWAAHLQHRPFVPRLLIIAMGNLSGGDFRWPQWLCFGLNALDSILVLLLLRRTLGASPWLPALAFTANVMLFSPAFFQHFFWDTQFWMGMPVPCVLGALLILGGERFAPWTRFAFALFLAVIATLSFSHGLVIWPVLLTYLLLDANFAPLRQRLIAAGAWLLAAIVMYAVYFSDFRNMASHAYELKPGDSALGFAADLTQWENIARAARFACGLIGNGFARSAFDSPDLVARSQMFGAMIVGALIIASIGCIFTKPGRVTWSRALPWLALAAYGVGMALAVAVGRAHLGEHRCTVPRYLVGTVYVLLAVVIVGFLLLREASVRRQCARYFGIAVLTAFIVCQWPLWRYGLHCCEVWNNARHQARGLLMFINHDAIQPWSINTLDNAQGYAKIAANQLREIGLLRTRLVETASLKEFRQDKNPLTPARAAVDSIEQQDATLIVRGHARFGPERPADVIPLTAPGSEQIIALGVPRPRPMLRLFNVDYEFTNHLEAPITDENRWEARIPLASLPAGITTLEAWALDSAKERVAKIEGAVKLPSQ